MPPSSEEVLDKAVKDAVDAKPTEATEEVVEQIEENSSGDENENEGSEGEQTEENQEEGELSEQEIAEAKFLYNSLKNPDLRPAILTSLLDQTKAAVETKTEQKETKKDIMGLLEEALGPEFKFLASKLGPALDKAIDAKVSEEREARIAENQRNEANRVNQEVESTLAKLARETKGLSKKLEPVMMRLSEEIHPGPNTTIEKYVRTLYREASARDSQKAVQANISDKIRRNAGDVPSRLETTQKGRQEDASKLPNKKMTLNESVEWAMKQLPNLNSRRG